MKALAVILAAGESLRMGAPKALLEVAPRVTFLARLVETFEAAGISALVVVGARAPEIAAAHPGLRFVLNERWPDGQFGSVRVGLRAALIQGAQRILIHPVDTPLISPRTAAQVLDGLDAAAAVIPTWAGGSGHPLGLRAQAAQAVLASSATTLEHAIAPLGPQLISVEDAAILDNLNSPAAYELRFGHAPRGIQATP